MIGPMTLERWQTLANQLLELKVISKKVKVETLFHHWESKEK
jgi:hypothetical protein